MNQDLFSPRVLSDLRSAAVRKAMRLRRPDLVDDLYSASLFRLVRRASRYAPDISGPSTWAGCVAASAMADWLRSAENHTGPDRRLTGQRRRSGAPLLPLDALPLEEGGRLPSVRDPDPDLRLDGVWELVEKLPSVTAQAVRLLALGFRTSEIARRLGLTQSAVCRRLKKAWPVLADGLPGYR